MDAYGRAEKAADLLYFEPRQESRLKWSDVGNAAVMMAPGAGVIDAALDGHWGRMATEFGLEAASLATGGAARFVKLAQVASKAGDAAKAAKLMKSAKAFSYLGAAGHLGIGGGQTGYHLYKGEKGQAAFAAAAAFGEILGLDVPVNAYRRSASGVTNAFGQVDDVVADAADTAARSGRASDGALDLTESNPITVRESLDLQDARAAQDVQEHAAYTNQVSLHSDRPKLQLHDDRPGSIKLDDSYDPAAFKRLNVKDQADGRLVPGEAELAAKLEPHMGTMRRWSGASGPDFEIMSGTRAGKTVDFLFTVNAPEQATQLNKNFAKNHAKGKIVKQIDKHAEKADYVPVDTTILDEANLRIVKSAVANLPPQLQAKFIFME